MERRVIQISENTKVLTLPQDFVRKWNICKGDSLHVVSEGNTLYISSKKPSQGREVTLASEVTTEKVLWDLFAAGIDTIHTTNTKVLTYCIALPYDITRCSEGQVTLTVTKEVQETSIHSQLRRLGYMVKHMETSAHEVLIKQIHTLRRCIVKFGCKNRTEEALILTYLTRMEENIERIPPLLHLLLSLLDEANSVAF